MGDGGPPQLVQDLARGLARCRRRPRSRPAAPAPAACPSRTPASTGSSIRAVHSESRPNRVRYQGEPAAKKTSSGLSMVVIRRPLRSARERSSHGRSRWSVPRPGSVVRSASSLAIRAASSTGRPAGPTTLPWSVTTSVQPTVVLPLGRQAQVPGQLQGGRCGADGRVRSGQLRRHLVIAPGERVRSGLSGGPSLPPRTCGIGARSRTSANASRSVTGWSSQEVTVSVSVSRPGASRRSTSRRTGVLRWAGPASASSRSRNVKSRPSPFSSVG